MAQTTTTDIPTVGAVIRAWRVFHGLSSKALAEKAGVRPGYLSEVENDKKRNPWLGQLEKLAAALEISLQDIQGRRLPPGVGEQGDDQAGGQGPFPGMAQSPQPQATAAVGSVLHQLLEQVQALTAAVSHLQADLAVLKQRVAILSSAAQARPMDAAQAAPALVVRPVSGEWAGYAWQQLQKGVPLIFSWIKSGEPIVPPRDMACLINLRLRLHSAGETELRGDGLVSIELLPLGEAFVESIISSPVFITRGIVEDGRIKLTLQDYRRGIPRMDMTGTLTGDGRLILGSYEAEGLLTQQRERGQFFLLNAVGVRMAGLNLDEGVGGGGVRARERPE